MAPIVVRIGLLAVGLAFAELGVEALANGAGYAALELTVAFVSLVAGSAGFIGPLLRGGDSKEVHRG